MNRELKFRVWSKITRRMMYDFDIMTPAMSKGYTFDLDAMQYTGARGADGVDIYEGDLVTGVFGRDKNRTSASVVEWSQKKCQWQVKVPNRFSMHESTAFKYYHLKDGLRVVGNVYEHPGLLGDTK